MAFRRTFTGSVFSSTTRVSEDSMSSNAACTTTTTNYEITDTGNTTMKVVVRVRPENEMEIRSNYQSVVKSLDEHVLVFDPSPDNEPKFRATSDGAYAKRRPILGKKHKDLRFAFDHVFDETASQSDVFANTTETIVEGVLDGINCSVFAYGATGAGKTYTMLGNLENPGVMFLTMMELYRRIDASKDEKTCEVAVSYCEVYNETIRDLLVPSAPLHLREDGQKGLVVAGLSRHTPKTANEILSMLEIGNRNRTQHPTDANATSSRSHAVFQVFIHQKARTAGLSAQVTSAKMSLIDLAGSERATVTTNRGARLREGANINKSLLALGNCINALADNKGKAVHVPYRNSKLTRLLKDSLGGNCRTVMIANVSPSGLSYEDTYNTLKYADRAKQIKTKLVRNVLSVDFHVTKYKTIVLELRREVSELKAKLDKKSSSVPSRETYDPAEATRLQNLVKTVYGERCRLRKQMAELDTSEREALLKVSRKERDIQRIVCTSSNESRKAKIYSRIDHLQRHVEEVHNQKESLNEKLCTNNEAIGRVQAEINNVCGDSNKPGSQALRHLMDTVVEAKKLEAGNAHQWRLTKLLLKFIKNQEREITKTEKLLVLSLSLVQRQHTVIRASRIHSPSLQESYETIVRMAEGEKGVAWADQSDLSADGLMDVSTSNFTHSQNAIFDNLLVSASPRARHSDVGGGAGGCGQVGSYGSPFPISTSLGILASSSSVTRTPHQMHNEAPLSPSARSAAVGGVREGGAMSTPKSFPLESDSISRPNTLFKRTTVDQDENECPNSSAFGSSPFVHRTTVSAGGVRCETSIGGVKTVAVASSGQANLLNQQSRSDSKLQISSSTKFSDGGALNSNVTPLRMTTVAKTLSNSASKLRSHYTLGDVNSVMALSHTHSLYDKPSSDSSSQGSTSMFSTQCVVTNRHMHVSNCTSAKKNSGSNSNPGSPRRIPAAISPPLRPKSANEVLGSQSARTDVKSGRVTAFTPIRHSATDVKSANPQTPTLPSSSVGGASRSHDTLPMTSPSFAKQQQSYASSKGPVCTRTDSGYSTTLSEISRNGNEIASPYLVPFSGAGPKYMSDFHSGGTGQPAFQIPPIDTNATNSNYTFTSLSSQLLNGQASLSQQSQTLSTSSDNSTGCVVDMSTSLKPRPAFQSAQFSGKVSSSFTTRSGSSFSPSQSALKDVRTAVLPTRSFCSFEDNFVSPGSNGIPKTPLGANTVSITPNVLRSGPLHSRLPPSSSVSSRNNYLSNSYHGTMTQSPGTNNYTRSPSHSYSRRPTNMSAELNMGGAKSAPFSLSGRFQPPPHPGTFGKSFPPGAPPTFTPAPLPILSSPSPSPSPEHDSHSDSTDMGSHIYQTIEPTPPPLPPPRSRNIYVPRPQSTPTGSGHTSSLSTGNGYQSRSSEAVDTGYTSRSRLYDSRILDKRAGHSSSKALNETFTIEPSNQTRASLYQSRQLRPKSAPDNGDRGSGKTNPYTPYPSSQPLSGTKHQQHSQGVERKLPSYLQMTKSAASKRVPREYKLSSSTSHPVSLGSHSRKAQDKENKGRSTSTTKSHSVKTTTLTSSSSKWNRRHPSTTSSGGSGQTAFIKSVKLHHGNGMPIGGGGGLLRSREPTTLIA